MFIQIDEFEMSIMTNMSLSWWLDSAWLIYNIYSY